MVNFCELSDWDRETNEVNCDSLYGAAVVSVPITSVASPGNPCKTACSWGTLMLGNKREGKDGSQGRRTRQV